MKKTTMLIFVLLLGALYARAWNTPALVSPADGDTEWTGTNFNWNSVSNSQYYQFQLDVTPNFNSGSLLTVTHGYINTSSGNTDTRADIVNMRFGTTYYWRVRAWVTGDTSAWSPVRSIITRDHVDFSSPVTGDTTWTGVTLNWQPHDGVSRYEWEADTVNTFNSAAYRTGQTPYINSTDGNADTRYDLTNTYFGKVYYWRVRAINSIDTSGWGTVNSFTTRDYVNASSPITNGDYWTGLRLNWSPHHGVVKYEWQADTTTAFNSTAFKTGQNNYVNSTDGNVDTQHDLTDIYFGQQYYWRVRPLTQ